MKYEVESKVKDFVKRFGTGEIEIDDSKFGNWTSSTYGTNTIYEQLANAIHEFEITDAQRFDYEAKANALNKMINMAYAHGIIRDTSLTKKNQVLEEKNKELTKQLNKKDEIVNKLLEEKGYWKAKAEIYERDIPSKDIEEGDVTN